LLPVYLFRERQSCRKPFIEEIGIRKERASLGFRVIAALRSRHRCPKRLRVAGQDGLRDLGFHLGFELLALRLLGNPTTRQKHQSTGAHGSRDEFHTRPMRTYCGAEGRS